MRYLLEPHSARVALKDLVHDGRFRVVDPPLDVLRSQAYVVVTEGAAAHDVAGTRLVDERVVRPSRDVPPIFCVRRAPYGADHVALKRAVLKLLAHLVEPDLNSAFSDVDEGGLGYVHVLAR